MKWSFGLLNSSLYLSHNHPSKAKGRLLSFCPSPRDNQLDPQGMLNEHCLYTAIRAFQCEYVYGHFSSALGSAPYRYQQRFLKHLSGVFDAMADFDQVALLVKLVTKPITVSM